MSRDSAATASFEALVNVPDESLNLAAASLAYAEDLYPELDRVACLAAFDEMAEAVAARMPERTPVTEQIARLNGFLFEEQGFLGNRDDYSDPRNSYLNEVLDRRLGIPISLSVVYLEVGWRLGMRFAGVGFPGHFLVKCPVNGGEVVIDPFHGGISLGARELTEIGTHILGAERFKKESLSGLLAAVSRREILLRMLRNLKHIYLGRNEHEQALAVINRMLTVAPLSVLDIRDRARVYDALDAMRAALADYQRFLELAPGGDEDGSVRLRVAELTTQVQRLN